MALNRDNGDARMRRQAIYFAFDRLSFFGRAWSLLSLNAGNCGRVGTTYMGTVGNPMNWNNIVIGENEEDSCDLAK